jgi:hypothetical protein
MGAAMRLTFRQFCHNEDMKMSDMLNTMEKEHFENLEVLLENYPLSTLLTKMATIIRLRVDAARVPEILENAGLSPKPYALSQRGTRMTQCRQLQELANRI